MAIVTPKTYALFSLGCRTNQAEMEEIGRRLTDYGLRLAGYRKQDDRMIVKSLGTNNKDGRMTGNSREDEQPEVVVVNTCVVTAKAEAETRKTIRRLRNQFPKAKLVVIGCAAEAKNSLGHEMPEADRYFGNKEGFDISRILEAVGKMEINSLQVTGDRLQKKCDKGGYMDNYIASGRKFIKIQEGCDKYCSYCLTAFVRGPVRSRPANEIIEEIRYWQENGVSEVILTGTNISLWRDGNKIIADLLRQIITDTNIPRISLSTVYPEMMDDRLINLVVQEPRLSNYLHLALQSGSVAVLERMNRKVDLIKLLANLQSIKRKIPYFTFRADIIVGFPDETDDEFTQTLEFIREAPISFAHVFHFSSRPGTVAVEMLANKKWKPVAKEVVDKRVTLINQTLVEIRKNEVEKQVGRIAQVLIIRQISNFDNEGRLHRLRQLTDPRNDNKLALAKDTNDYWEGLTDSDWTVRIGLQPTVYGQRMTKGGIISAKITGFDDDQLVGEIISLPI